MFRNKKRRIQQLFVACVVGVVIGVLMPVRLGHICAIEAETTALGPNAVPSESAFISVAEMVYPAVVSITTVHIEKVKGFGYREFGPFNEDFFGQFFKDFFGQFPEEREYRAVGLGSGVIIDKDGHILTNHHVVEGSEKDQVTVKLPDGREFKGKITGVDPRSDLAVVKIEAKDLPCARLGDSDRVKIGQWAIAIGNPFAFVLNDPNPTMTVGVISAIHRTLPQTMETGRYYGDLIQTDAAINRGNSGGPLVNIDGEVIGINVAIFTTTGGYQGVGFAVPINTAKEVIDDLIKGKKVLYGWLGVKVQDITQNLAEYFGLSTRDGVLVAEVLVGSPAEDGGLKEGDIIRTLEGKEVKSTQELIKEVSRSKVGKRIQVGVIRNKQPLNLWLKVGERPATLTELKEPEPHKQWRGLKVSDITQELARRYGLSLTTKGVVVIKVEVGSPAEEAGIREGDIIDEINRHPIGRLGDYTKAISEAKGSALVRTNRGYFIVKESEG